jgi:hypothetical protein
MEHPDSNSMVAFTKRQLPPAEMLVVSRHLVQCPLCRDEIDLLTSSERARTQTIEWYPSDDVTWHLSDEEIAMAADGEVMLDPDALAHFDGCADCRRLRDDLQKFNAPVVMMQPRDVRGFKLKSAWWTVGGVAAAAVLTVAILLPHHHQSTPVTTPMIASLQDGGGVIGIDAKGALHSSQELPPAYRSLLQAALDSRRLPEPDAAPQYASDLETLRGEAASPIGFAVRSPIRETTTATPEFLWQRLPDAFSYHVEIYDHRYQLVATSPEITGTNWIPSRALAPGKEYTWVVKAKTPHGVLQAPSTPQPEAQFSVADVNALAAIETAKNKYPNSRLLLACLYAQAGIKAMARNEAEALEQQNRNSDLAHALAKSLSNGAPAAR